MCHSIIFSIYIILSIWNTIPTEAERLEREKEYQSDIEMKKYTTFDPEAELSNEDRWEKNRQMFMNLPKTPNTPGFGLNPMTPRTTAFTQLNGAPGPSRTPRSGGGLPFREFYGDQKVPDANVR